MITTVRDAATWQLPRILTGIAWVDAITGGGLPRGSATLVYGEPGSGKSTMLAQVAGSVRDSVYITREEELGSVAQRFIRLGLRRDCVLSDDLDALQSATSIAIVDSLQLTSDAVETCRNAVELARRKGIAVVLVCHAIKLGGAAGPLLLQHLIDITLHVLREPHAIVCEKNRYGAAGVGVPLIMDERGLRYDSGYDVRRNAVSRARQPRGFFGRRSVAASAAG
jgi:DNA repair protein RadA/Sms